VFIRKKEYTLFVGLYTWIMDAAIRINVGGSAPLNVDQRHISLIKDKISG
jgi:hypothetical protein